MTPVSPRLVLQVVVPLLVVRSFFQGGKTVKPFQVEFLNAEEARVASNLYDSFDTPLVQCRKDLEPWQNDNVLRWMDRQQPWLDWVWDMTTDNSDNTNNNTNSSNHKPHYLVLFVNRDTGIGQISKSRLKKATWVWQDTNGHNHTATPTLPTRSKVGMERFYLRLEMDTDTDTNTTKNYTNTDGDWPQPRQLWATLDQDGPLSYDVAPYLKCSRLEQQTPPSPKTKPKIGACVTRFWGQHDLLPEWILYHRLMGIQHFWLFVNEPFENVVNATGLPRHDTDITYIPYNYNWENLKHKRDNLKLPFGGENLFQTTANNQCLYLAKQHNLDWIFTPDLDEYISFWDDKLADQQFPLQQYLKQYDADPKYQDLGELCLTASAYGRHSKLQSKEDIGQTMKLSIDFTHRLDRERGDAGGRPKCFFRPNVTNDIWQHGQANGGGSYATQRDQIELAHFRTPVNGVYGTNGVARLIDYPHIMRDKYKETILNQLQEANLQLPNLLKHSSGKYGTNWVGNSNNATKGQKT